MFLLSEKDCLSFPRRTHTRWSLLRFGIKDDNLKHPDKPDEPTDVIPDIY